MSKLSGFSDCRGVSYFHIVALSVSFLPTGSQSDDVIVVRESPPKSPLFLDGVDILEFIQLFEPAFVALSHQNASAVSQVAVMTVLSVTK